MEGLAVRSRAPRRYQHATEDRDRVLAEALRKPAEDAEVVPFPELFREYFAHVALMRRCEPDGKRPGRYL